MTSALVAIGTLGWLIGYIGAVRVGIRQRSYAVPIAATAFNFAYEIVLAISFLSEKISFFRMMFAAWAFVDLGVLLTVILWAHRDPTLGWSRRRVHSFVWSLVLGFGLFLTWYAITQGPENAAFYPAYLENVIMSALFIGLFLRRSGPAGQSLIMAWGKYLGTAAMTCLYGIVLNRPFGLACGLVCFVLDTAYVILLHRGARRPAVVRTDVSSPKAA